MVSAFASSWPSPPEPETPRKKEESLKALKALVRDWDLLGRERIGRRTKGNDYGTEEEKVSDGGEMRSKDKQGNSQEGQIHIMCKYNDLLLQNNCIFLT